MKHMVQLKLKAFFNSTQILNSQEDFNNQVILIYDSTLLSPH